jgi:hypothetical protein
MVTTRTQLQNAADAAALAGASGLLPGRSDTAILARAISFASFNGAMLDSGAAPVVITEADVTFPKTTLSRVVTLGRRRPATECACSSARRSSPPGQPRRRHRGRSGASVRHLLVALLEAVVHPGPLERSRCRQPIRRRRALRSLHDRLHRSRRRRPAGDVKVGKPAANDGRFKLLLRLLPPIGSDQGDPLSGGNWYRQWIAECCPYLIEVGDRLQIEPGNMVGPTRQGIDQLIARIPARTGIAPHKAWWARPSEEARALCWSDDSILRWLRIPDAKSHRDENRCFLCRKHRRPRFGHRTLWSKNPPPAVPCERRTGTVASSRASLSSSRGNSWLLARAATTRLRIRCDEPG